jgi:hypothetical protein
MRPHPKLRKTYVKESVGHHIPFLACFVSDKAWCYKRPRRETLGRACQHADGLVRQSR